MSDPAGVLQRIPELEPFTRYPSVKKALASGRPHKLYRALWWGKLLGRFRREHRDIAKELLANRRLFVEPVESAPSHSTINGIGTAIYGTAELDDQDGTSIGTQFIVFVFVPIFPLGQYLWHKQGNSYRVFGKVPFGPLAYFWRNVFAVGLGATLLGTAVSAVQSARFDEVVVVNDLPVEVKAHIGETSHRIAPGKKRTFAHVPVGEALVQVTLDGDLLEEGLIDVSAGNDLHVWNVAGAGLLYYQEVVYVVTGSGGNIAEPENYCGQNAVVVDDVDYAFREPPSTISMSGDREVRSHFDLWEGGWSNCKDTLMWTSPTLVTGILLEAVDVHDPDSVGEVVLSMSLSAGPEAVLEWLEAELVEEDTVALHRARQDAARLLERDLLDEYRQREIEQPDDVHAAYLRIRLEEDGATSVALLEDALARWPSDYWLLKAYAWNLRASERFDDALVPYERLFNGTDRDEDLFAYAEALAATGRHDRALEALEGLPDPEWETLIGRGMLSAHLGIPLTAGHLEGLGLYGLDIPTFQARVGTKIRARERNELAPEVAAAVDVVSVLHTDPLAALAALEALPDDGYIWIDPASATLLYGELAATGQAERAAAFADNYGGAEAFAEVHAERPDIVRMKHDVAAATLFAASRQPERSAGDAAALRERAARWDFFKGVTTHALANW